MSMGSIDLKEIEKKWKARGFSFGIWNDKPGQKWEHFVHHVDEVFLVVDGKVELEMLGKKWLPKPGEEVLIPAKATHSVRNVGETGSRWLYGYKT